MSSSSVSNEKPAKHSSTSLSSSSSYKKLWSSTDKLTREKQKGVRVSPHNRKAWLTKIRGQPEIPMKAGLGIIIYHTTESGGQESPVKQVGGLRVY